MEPQGEQAQFELRHWDGTSDEEEGFDQDESCEHYGVECDGSCFCRCSDCVGFEG